MNKSYVNYTTMTFNLILCPKGKSNNSFLFRSYVNLSDFNTCIVFLRTFLLGVIR
jgi:hypothetical protein